MRQSNTLDNLSDPGFEVEITSGGRALDSGASERAAPTLSPARAAAKARARKRKALIIAASAALMSALVLWSWLSNPHTLIPSDAVARVNGEYIYERDVTREMDITRTINEIGKLDNQPPPTAPSALESVITRLLQLQDARKAGVEVTADDVERSLVEVPKRAGLTQEQLAGVLAKYNRTLDDLRVSVRDALMISRHITRNVAAGVKNDQERLTVTNEWQTRLAQSARITRYKPAEAGPAPRVGSQAPDFTLKDLQGNQVRLSALRGRPVMINFWATWCPPCRAEIPDIVKVYKAMLKAESYEILGIATQSDSETIKAFVREFDMAYPVLPDVEGRVISLYRVVPIPTSFFIDKEGIIRDIRVGIVDTKTMEKWLLAK